MKNLFFILAILSVPTAVGACDDVLMAVIYGRDEVSEFDQKVEKVSGALRRVAERARIGAWQDASNAYDEVMNGWVDIYRRFLAEPPPGLTTHPDWPGLLKSFSSEIQGLRDLVDAKETEPVHEKIRTMQATLINTYFQGGTPAARIAALKTTLEPIEKLKVELSKPGVTRTTLQLLLATLRTRLETMMRVTPAVKNEGEALVQAVQKASDKLTGDPVPPSFSQDLEALSTQADSFRELFTRKAGEPAPEQTLKKE